MVNQKLQEIGQKLDVSEKDIKDLGKTDFKSRILYWIITAAIAILSFILGFFAGKGSCPPAGGGYPFSMGLVPVAFSGKGKNFKISVLLVSVIAFLVALNAVPVFGQAIDYNVYGRC